MSYYRVLGGNWGEGYKPGDIIELDFEAAKKRLEDGDVEVYNGVVPKKIEVASVEVSKETPIEVSKETPVEVQSKVEKYFCVLCNKEHFPVGRGKKMWTEHLKYKKV